MRNAAVPSLLLLALSAGCGPKVEAPSAAASRAGARSFRVTAAPVSSRPLSYAITAVGSLDAHEVVTVPARVEGTLERLGFQEGDRVTPDTVLAVVDGERFALEEEQARASVARADASVASAAARTEQAKAALAEAETSLARRRALRAENPGFVSEEEISTQEGSVARLKASLEEARAGEVEAKAAVAEAKARLALAGKSLADSRVRAPIAGVIEAKHVSAGQYVKVGESLATIVDTRKLRLRFRVGEAESVRLVAGQETRFRVRALPGKDLRATLFHVNATADPQTRMVECLASVEAPDPALKPGFFATVSVEVSRKDAAIVIPDEAILPTERGFVAFVVEGGRAKARDLSLGLHTKDGGVEVIGGLAPGETLVVRGARSLQDGVPVEIVAGGGAPAEAGK